LRGLDDKMKIVRNTVVMDSRVRVGIAICIKKSAKSRRWSNCGRMCLDMRYLHEFKMVEHVHSVRVEI
jgi:hypothetical protein